MEFLADTLPLNLTWNPEDTYQTLLSWKDEGKGKIESDSKGKTKRKTKAWYDRRDPLIFGKTPKTLLLLIGSRG